MAAMRRRLTRILTAAGLFAAAGVAADEAPRLTDLGEAEFQAQAAADLRCLKGWAEGLKDLLDRAEANPALFAAKPERWTLDEDRELRSLWGGALDHLYALEGLKRFYGDYGKLKLPAREQAFALAHAAFTAQYAEGLRWIELTRGKDRLETLLDEADPERGVPADAFAGLKYQLLHVATIARFRASDRRFRRQADRIEDPWLKAHPAEAAARAHAVLKRRGLQDLIGNGADIVGDAAFDLWFPAQKGIAEWMGDTKVRRLKRTLVTPEQARELAGHCRPGDLIVERRNWYLSNVGLPGFWPHAVLYVGTPEDLSAFDADPGTKAWLGGLPGAPATLAKALEALAPAAWKAYAAPGADGNPHRVMEAVSEGVVFNSAEESCCGDYVAALRPRLGMADKAQALLEAFRHHGKPYDFNFDFVTDSALVCSELVYKAYLPGQGKAGLRIPLSRVCGRSTLPPNEIIRLFDQEGDAPGRQLDFVWFVDGLEKTKGAVVRDAATLKASWRRPKWDIAQK